MTARALKSNGANANSPFTDPASRFAAGRLGMLIFLISVGMLFAASLVGYFALRLQPYFRDGSKHWPDDLPSLPGILVYSTLILALSSAAMQGALVSIRRGLTGRLKWLMLATFSLGMLFLAMQVWAWNGWLASLEGMWEESQEHTWALMSFYVLTGTHAAHVVGGLIPMLIVTVNAWRNRYSETYFPGVCYNAMYWHFLGVVWVILYLTLLVGT